MTPYSSAGGDGGGGGATAAAVLVFPALRREGCLDCGTEVVGRREPPVLALSRNTTAV